MSGFPAKLLLFGEYSILLGSSALSIPLDIFSASLELIGNEAGESKAMALASNHQLKILSDHFNSEHVQFAEFLDLKRFNDDVNQGLFFASSIPQRYGMGSSGALCAAVVARYRLASDDSNIAGKQIVSDITRQSLIRMESFFHGRSSGFDPLVSLLKTPLLSGIDGQITEINSGKVPHGPAGTGILLADTGQPCSTGPLVNAFLERFAPAGMVSKTGEAFCSLVNATIQNYLAEEHKGFWENINQLSDFQLEHFRHLLPDKFLPIWSAGLRKGLFSMKLCGSGGGGFLLVFTPAMELTMDYFNRCGIPVTALPPPVH